MEPYDWKFWYISTLFTGLKSTQTSLTSTTARVLPMYVCPILCRVYYVDGEGATYIYPRGPEGSMNKAYSHCCLSIILSFTIETTK